MKILSIFIHLLVFIFLLTKTVYEFYYRQPIPLPGYSAKDIEKFYGDFSYQMYQNIVFTLGIFILLVARIRSKKTTSLFSGIFYPIILIMVFMVTIFIISNPNSLNINIGNLVLLIVGVILAVYGLIGIIRKEITWPIKRAFGWNDYKGNGAVLMGVILFLIGCLIAFFQLSAFYIF